MSPRVLLLSLLILLAVPVVPGTTARADSPKLGSYYLAIGDSYSLGALTPDIMPDANCSASDAPSFACIFFRYLKQINPGLQIQNFSEAGVDSCELAGAGHRCFSTTPMANPLDAAVQFISAHQGEVSPITVTFGGGDLLPLLPQALTDPTGTAARLPGVLTRYRTNLDTVLSRLRTAAGPDAEIIVTTQINPLGGIGSPPLPAGVPDLAQRALDSLDGIMKSEAPKYNAVIADVEAAFDSNPGGAALLTFVPTSLVSGDPAKINPYPTPDGYKVFADTVIKASGYIVPLTLKAKLGSKSVHPGKSEKLKGTTSAGATLKITVKLPKKKTKSINKTAGTDGAYAASFNVGKTSGKGTVKVCASDANGQSKCSSKLTFAVK